MTDLISKIIYDETFKFSKQNITYSFSKEENGGRYKAVHHLV
ncbi:MAG: hypothetical protein OEY94_10195 [Alphaproteobacteria bacterium]|nr:hypothetical protein [Alphaproteobacteria bacterium]